MALILCVDDENYILKTYKAIFARRGHEVTCCMDGKQALEAFAQKPADLVILDLKMPVMSGTEALQEFRKRPDSFNVPIIVVSGVNTESSIYDSMSLGANDYIVKPFDPSELLAKVQIALKRRDDAVVQELGLAQGSRFVGRFEIRQKLGSGGFGAVYEAWDFSQGCEVALKVFDLPASKRSDKRFIATFLREAYALSKLAHPNIVRFMDFGQSGNFYYMCMEYLVGETLDKVIEKRGVVPEQYLAMIGFDVAGAIEYLSRQKMVHRDIKPSNIMITATDVKLIDFGLAKQAADETISGRDEFRATPLFSSPEYIDGQEEIDSLSDIFSLGATLYYAATVTYPFDGENLLQIFHSHFTQRPPLLSDKSPQHSRRFAELVDRMMARQRKDRPPPKEVAAVLGEIVAAM